MCFNKPLIGNRILPLLKKEHHLIYYLQKKWPSQQRTKSDNSGKGNTGLLQYSSLKTGNLSPGQRVGP